MNENPLISIVVPVYNVEKYLVECLESLRAQTYGNIEIICVNDGSTDRSGLVLDFFAGLDSRIKVIVQENKGLPGARNTGIDAASGDIVMFVDSDDTIEPKACATVAAAFVENSGVDANDAEPIEGAAAEAAAKDVDALVFGTNCFGYGRSLDPWYYDVLTTGDSVYEEFSTDILFKEKSRPFVWREAFSLPFLNSNGIRFDEDIKYGEDQVFQFVVFPRASKTVFISDRIYNYRMGRKGSLMDGLGSKAIIKLRKHVVIADRICEHWSKTGDIEKYGSELFRWTIDFLGYDVLKQEAKYQVELCESIRAMWNRWFAPGTADAAGLTPTEMQRYHWIADSLSIAQREEVSAKGIDKNARKMAFEGRGAAGKLKEHLYVPYSKFRNGCRRIFPAPSRSMNMYLDEVHDHIERVSETGGAGTASNELFLLMLERDAKQKDNVGR